MVCLAVYLVVAHLIFRSDRLELFAKLGEASNIITIPFLALSIYFAGLQLRNDNAKSERHERKLRIDALLDARQKILREMRWNDEPADTFCMPETTDGNAITRLA